MVSYGPYSIDLEIHNFKSYYERKTRVRIDKPITLLVGPNGEGKTNLIHSLLLALDGLIQHSRKLRKTSLWTKRANLLRDRSQLVSLAEVNMHDLARGALLRPYGRRRLPPSLDPSNALTVGKRKGSFHLTVNRPDRLSKKREIDCAQVLVEFSRGQLDSGGYTVSDYSLHHLQNLDLAFIPSDGTPLDVFPARVHQLFLERYSSKEGAAEQARFREVVAQYYPRDESLILDFRTGRTADPGMQERYSAKFLSETLATGAKFELVSYLFPLLLDKNSELTEWVAFVLMDELGGGLHMARQKQALSAIISALDREIELRRRVRIISTTHSPLIYSVLSQRPDLVDILFVMREPGFPSTAVRLDEESDADINKMMRQELWLNALKLSHALVFVEGKTDKWFFDEVFRPHPESTVLRTGGANFPRILAEVISSLEPAPRGAYWQVVESGTENMAAASQERLGEAGIELRLAPLPRSSVEELMCGFEFKGRASLLWHGMRSFAARLTESSETLQEEVPLQISDVDGAEQELRERGKEGFDSFIGTWKRGTRFRNLYQFCGSNWPAILLEPERRAIEQLLERISRSVNNGSG